jgi:hypothetical protein
MADTFASFAAKLDRLTDEFIGSSLSAKMNKLGGETKKDAAKAVSADLGDMSMSNWRRGSPIQITARYDVRGDTVEVTAAPRARGPFTVLEEGRRAGAATDLVLVGRVRKKSGTRRAKSRGRGQGATAGKNTWSEAVEIMERETPRRMAEIVAKAVRSADL